MSYIELLEDWYTARKQDGSVVDVKFFPMEVSSEDHARVAYEIVTGKRDSRPLDLSGL
jgi:hypothetical protein